MKVRDGCAGILIAFDDLKNACIKGKASKSTSESIDKLSIAVSLFSSPPNPFPFGKLESLIRLPLVNLYKQHVELALKFSEEVVSVVIQKELKPRLQSSKSREANDYRGWEDAVNSLLSGVLDFLEDNNAVKTRTLVGSHFMKPLCDYFFPRAPVDLSRISVNLRCTAYMLLSDIAVQHPTNQRRMREGGTLGGFRLGKLIADSKDYVVLETLLNLLARLIPSSSDPNKHLSYIKSVFVISGQFPVCGQEIVDLLQKEAIKDWEATSTKIINAVAKADISMPQPFDVDAVVVCGTTYPQTEVSDKFFVDRASFFVNVKQEDDMYESLQVYFDTVSRIEILTEGEMFSVSVSMTCPPKLAEKPIATQENMTMLLTTKLLHADHDRFMNALRYRALASKVVAGNSVAPFSSRVSITESSAILEHDDTQTFEPESSLSKVTTVNKFYDASSVKSFAPDSDSLDNQVDSVGDDANPGAENAIVNQDKTPLSASSTASLSFGTSGKRATEMTAPAISEAMIEGSGNLGREDDLSGCVTLNIATLDAGKAMDTNHAHNKSCSKTGEIRRKEDEGNNVLSAPATDKNPKKRDDRKVGISNKMKKKGEKDAGVESVKQATRASVVTKAPKRANARDAPRNMVDKDSVPSENGSLPLETVKNVKHSNEGPALSSPHKRKNRGSPSESNGDEHILEPRKKLRSSLEQAIKPKATMTRPDRGVTKTRKPSPPMSLKDEDVGSDAANDKSPKTCQTAGAKANTPRNMKIDLSHPERGEEHVNISRVKQSEYARSYSREKTCRQLKENMEMNTDREGLRELTIPLDADLVSTNEESVPEARGRKKTTIENVPGANALQVGSGIADDDIAHNLSISSTGTRKTQKKPDGKDAPLREETYSSKGGVPSAKASNEGKQKANKAVVSKPGIRAHAGAAGTVIDLTSSPSMNVRMSDRRAREVTPMQIEDDPPQNVNAPAVDTIVPGKGHRVTFDENPRRKSASFESIYKINRHQHFHESGRDAPHGGRDWERRKIFAREDGTGHPPRTRVPELSNYEHNKMRMDNKYMDPPSAEPGMKELMEVLAAIQQAVAEKIVNKSRAVRADIRIARANLLHDAAQDLAGMREESIGHLDNLLLIESGYASFGRSVAGAYDNALKDLQQGHTFMQQTVFAHDRGSLSKIMPKSLFSANVPSVFLKHPGT